jgi:hypothetical protein
MEMTKPWIPLLLGALAWLAPSPASAQADQEATFAYAAVKRGRADYAEMRLQQIFCEIPATDPSTRRLVEVFDTARSRHLAYARSLLSYIEAPRPKKRLRHEVAIAAERADSTMLSFDNAVRDARVRIAGKPYYTLLPLIAMADASKHVRSLYRSGRLDSQTMRRELDPPDWKTAVELRSNLDCARI